MTHHELRDRIVGATVIDVDTEQWGSTSVVNVVRLSSGVELEWADGVLLVVKERDVVVQVTE